MNSRKLLTGPYLVWAIAFILIPLAMIFYYGFTAADGSFSFANIPAIGTMKNLINEVESDMKRILKYIISKAQAGQSVSCFLNKHGYSRHCIIQLKKNPLGILVNDCHAYVTAMLKEGDILTTAISDNAPSENIVPVPMDLHIIYEDEDILVVNKPADMPVHPSMNNYENTLANGLAFYFKQKGYIFVFRCINRLDRDTTGLLVIAKHMLSAAILSNDMMNRNIHRTYLAVTSGIPPVRGTINAPIGRLEGSTIERRIDCAHGEPAVTHYHLLQSKHNYSLVELKLETGRTHQIRVHMQYLSHPLLGDFIYNPTDNTLPRQALHSYRLSFNHPITKFPLSFEAPLPTDMAQLFAD